jgi:hypothetical protein
MTDENYLANFEDIIGKPLHQATRDDLLRFIELNVTPRQHVVDVIAATTARIRRLNHNQEFDYLCQQLQVLANWLGANGHKDTGAFEICTRLAESLPYLIDHLQDVLELVTAPANTLHAVPETH